MANKPTYEELEQRVKELEAKVPGDGLPSSALKESMERFSQLINNFPGPVFMKDSKLRLVYTNKTYIDLFGEDRIGKNPEETWPPEIAEKLRKNDELVLGKGTPIEFEEEVLQKGERRKYLTVKFPIGQAGKQTLLGGVGIDITERKRIAKELELRGEIIGHIAEGVILIQVSSSTIVYANSKFEEMFGYEIGGLIGKNISIVNAPTDKAPSETAEDIIRSLNENGTWEGEVLNMRKDGTVFWCHANVSTFEHPEYGKVWISIHTDITQRKKVETALKESREKYRTLFDTAPMGIGIADLEGKLYTVNQVLKDMFGFPDDLTALDLEQFYEYPGERSKLVQELKASGRVRDWECRFKRADGTTFIGMLNIDSIILDGQPRILTCARDITEQKWNEGYINAHMARQTAVAELGQIALANIPILNLMERAVVLLAQVLEVELAKVLELQPDGQELLVVAGAGWKKGVVGHAKVSSGIESQAGYTLRVKNPVIVEDLSSETRFSGPPLLFEHGVVSGMSIDIEGNVRPYGVLGVHSVKPRSFSPEDVKFIHSVANILAMAVERKRIDMELRRSEENYRLLFESSQDCICHISLDGKILNMNPAGCQINGFDNVKEVIGKSCTSSIKENKATAQEAVRRAGSGETVSLQYMSVDKSGRKIWWDSNVVPVKGRDGAITSVLRISRNVTDKRKMEEEVIRAQRIESIGILAGGIAHDFNNLLTIISGRISLAKVMSDPDELYESLSAAEKACKRAADITKRLLTFSKGGIPVTKTVSIAGLIIESADFASRGSQVKVNAAVPDDLWPVDIDEGQMSQVINNLIINAQQAMPDGGSICVSAENIVIDEKSGLPLLHPGSYVKITVQDTGIGIPAEDLSKIFEPYFTTKPTGSGLGLATSYSIVKNHKGFIFAESEEGVGTAFNIYLPTSKRKTVKKKEVEACKISVVGIVRILLMDDDEMLRSSSTDMLRNLGYEVSTANDGAEAVELYKKAKDAGRPFDIVILDLTVPGGMGGKETIRRLIEVDPNVKAIVSSGYSDDPVMSDFSDYGFKSVLTKPYDIEKLRNSLKEIIA